MTLALRRLDPDNQRWAALQKARARAKADAAFDTKDPRERKAELNEISDTFERYSGDLGRKLYLIQNSIFGLDIQPIATQIAKLRFFISLAIKQQPNANPNNWPSPKLRPSNISKPNSPLTASATSTLTPAKPNANAKTKTKNSAKNSPNKANQPAFPQRPPNKSPAGTPTTQKPQPPGSTPNTCSASPMALTSSSATRRTLKLNTSPVKIEHDLKRSSVGWAIYTNISFGKGLILFPIRESSHILPMTAMSHSLRKKEFENSCYKISYSILSELRPKHLKHLFMQLFLFYRRKDLLTPTFT